MMENCNGLAVDLESTLATGTAEREAAKAMVERSVKRGSTLGADKDYDVAEFVQAMRDHGVTPHVAQKKAGSAALFLPFLPMLPTPILLNNILYDISEVPIPLDKVDSNDIHNPRVLDMNFVRNFMLVIGPISSQFDFLTFYVMLVVLQANEKLFQTGWFVKSLCTQVLVIFIIRTRGNPLKSRAHPLLTATSLAVVAVAVLLLFTPTGTYFGFVPPPAKFYFILGGMTLVYLFVVELAKQGFYRWAAAGRRPPRSSSRT